MQQLGTIVKRKKTKEEETNFLPLSSRKETEN